MSGETYENLGGQSVEWGTAGVVTGVSCGTILNASAKESGSTQLIENNMGAVVGLTAYDSVTVVSLTILYDPTTATPPALWDTAAFDGVNGFISSIGKDWGNKQHRQVQVEVTLHKHVAIA